MENTLSGIFSLKRMDTISIRVNWSSFATLQMSVITFHRIDTSNARALRQWVARNSVVISSAAS